MVASSKLSGALRVAAWPAMLIAAALSLRLLVGQAYSVPSRSMEPALEPGDHVLVTRLFGGQPSRGDVVVFEASDGHALIKRVIGLPGDSVDVVGERVAINGTTLAEPYAMVSGSDAHSTHLVPAGHYFVMGDNRDNSEDSREIGFISREAIVGRARLIYWSVERDSAGATPTVRWERIFEPVR